VVIIISNQHKSDKCIECIAGQSSRMVGGIEGRSGDESGQDDWVGSVDSHFSPAAAAAVVAFTMSRLDFFDLFFSVHALLIIITSIEKQRM
jgi:hypothetical protein